MNLIQPTPVFIILCLALLLSSTVVRVKALPKKEFEDDFANIDEYVDTQRESLGIPGLSLGIMHGNEIVHEQGFGVADSTGQTVTPQTPFHIGSIGKSFTALAVMQLVEASKIELDVPVQKFLPWFTLADKNASAQITVRHLSNHTSGISTTDGNLFWDSTASMEEAVRQMRTVQPTYPAGKKYQYCNMLTADYPGKRLLKTPVDIQSLGRVLSLMVPMKITPWGQRCILEILDDAKSQIQNWI